MSLLPTIDYSNIKDIRFYCKKTKKNGSEPVLIAVGYQIFLEKPSNPVGCPCVGEFEYGFYSFVHFASFLQMHALYFILTRTYIGGYTVFDDDSTVHENVKNLVEQDLYYFQQRQLVAVFTQNTEKDAKRKQRPSLPTPPAGCLAADHVPSHPICKLS